jgi:hypothetical protein
MFLNSLGKLLTQALVFQPGVPCHIIQRGNDRNLCFFDVHEVRKAVSLGHSFHSRFHREPTLRVVVTKVTFEECKVCVPLNSLC